MIRDLYGASTGSRPLSEPAARSLVAQWILYDWIRAAFIAVGFVGAVKGTSTVYRAYVCG